MEEFVEEEEVSRVQHRQRMNVRDSNVVSGSSRKPRSRVEKLSRRGVRSDGKNETKWEEGQRAAEDQGPTCGVCTEVIVNYGVGSCGHFVCGDCAHRLRFLYRKKECSFCKTLLEEVVVSDSPDDALVAAKKRRFHYDDEVQTWFKSEKVMKHYRQLRKPQCPSCHSHFQTVEALKQHVRSFHKKALCDSCVENGSKYLCDMELYSIKETRGSGPTEFAKHRESHPFCLFCKEHVFDSEALYAHLQRQHESCFLCRRNGIQYEYYRNYYDLESHYREDHFICDDSTCRGVVFDNPTDLKVHRKRQHDVGRGGNVRINLSVFQASSARHTSQRPSHRGRQNFEAQLADSNRAQSAYLAGGRNPPESSSRMAPAPMPRVSEPQTSDSDVGEPQQQTTGTERPVMPSLPVNQEEESARNAVLLRSLRDALDVADFDQLRDASGQFRSGQLDAESYFETVDRLLGPDAKRLLPEMTMLLRDGDQRTELSRLVRGAYRLLEAPSTDSVLVPEVETSSMPSGAFPALGGGQASIRRSAHQYGQRSGQVTAGDFPTLGGDRARPAQAMSQKAPARSSTGQAARESREPRSEQFPTLDGRLPSGGTTSAASKQGARPSVTASKAQRGPTGRVQPTPASAQQRSTQSASTEELFPSLGGGAGGLSKEESTDPSMRVGAVWGGAARRAYQNQAPEPTQSEPEPLAVESVSSFPELAGALSISSPGSTGNAGSSRGQGNSSTPLRAPSGNKFRAGVTDLGAVEQRRRSKLANSAVPNIGSNGFAWDAAKKKKNKQKAQEELNAQKK
ncbi:hypothetical protein NDN08_003249 [Rhodosorus marinus]|uniref:RING-type domain-containing protein n=1 Tax=Rhodosorus marinus TaxID=101924 RepID=A0AAV8V1U6_9RHOD|nr:hypothetical protein NDN08_003249 [Rhodosorus marinus]